jgi:hypothetical protein
MLSTTPRLRGTADQNETFISIVFPFSIQEKINPYIVTDLYHEDNLKRHKCKVTKKSR